MKLNFMYSIHASSPTKLQKILEVPNITCIFFVVSENFLTFASRTIEHLISHISYMIKLTLLFLLTLLSLMADAQSVVVDGMTLHFIQKMLICEFGGLARAEPNVFELCRA